MRLREPPSPPAPPARGCCRSRPRASWWSFLEECGQEDLLKNDACRKTSVLFSVGLEFQMNVPFGTCEGLAPGAGTDSLTPPRRRVSLLTTRMSVLRTSAGRPACPC